MKTTNKMPLLDSCKRRSKELQSAKVAARKKANPQPAKQARLTAPTPKATPPRPAMVHDKPTTLAQPDATPVVRLTETEMTSGKTFPEIMAARRRRGEDVPFGKVFRLSGIPGNAYTIRGGAVTGGPRKP